MTKTHSIQHAGSTNTGRVRDQNEDHWFADGDRNLYIVSDGIGGHAGGEVASRIVTQLLPQRMLDRLRSVNNLADESSQDELTEVIADVSERMRDEAAEHASLAGLGATLVALVIRKEVALVMHLGDSRLYRLRKSELLQLTVDHNYGQKFDATDEERRVIVNSSVASCLTCYMGMQGRPIVTKQLIRVMPRDRFLLCSDGLTGMVSDTIIRKCLLRNSSPEVACEQLIHCANAAGGRDNITAVVVDIVSG